MPTQLYLTPADQGRFLTWEEFRSASAEEGFRYELIHGRLEVVPLPNLPHDRLRKWLERRFDEYGAHCPDVINHVQAPARVFLPSIEEGITAPEPDVACYSDFPLDQPIDEVNWRDVSPILVAEILSEDTADKDLERNLRLYRQVPSIREYWIVDTRESFDRPALIVYRRRGQRWAAPRTVPAGGTYTTRLLPGFSLVLDPHAGA
jgi:Uma2 family endonuclease